jgi:integrase
MTSNQSVHFSSESHEWYTPPWLVELARDFLGSIDLDPASSDEAQQTVQAAIYHTEETNGLAQPWHGRVYLNPPYGDAVEVWVNAVVERYEHGDIDEALLLVAARTDTGWYDPLFRYPRCYIKRRVNFIPSAAHLERRRQEGKEPPGSPSFPSVIVYFGPNVERFRTRFDGHLFDKYYGRVEIPPTALATTAPAPLTFTPDILAGQLAPSSIAKYRQDFTAYLAYADGPGTALDAATFARWRAWLAQETSYSPHTINRMLAAIKRLMKEAASQGYITYEQSAAFERIEGVKPRALRERLKQHSRTRISREDMRRLCEAPDRSTLVGARDAALLATLASSGIRESEAASLTTGQIEQRGKGYILVVKGKTDTDPREAPLSMEAYDLILAWLRQRPILSPNVFTSFAGRGNRATDKAMSSVAVWQVVQKYARACGLEHIKPHDFRRFLGTQLARRDIRLAQKALGHKNINTTAKHYDLDELEAGLTDGLY